MIDMHSHIVFDVDDGSESLEESIEMIRTAKERGIKAMFATPHFIEGSMTAESIEVNERLAILRRELKKQAIDMPIYCGHEIFLDYDSLAHLKEGLSLSLNNTKYVLMEMPMQFPLNNLEDILFEFTVNGYVPIIAHPERYLYVQEDIDKVARWIKLGVLFQMNLTTMYGRYGQAAKKTAIKMLKRQMYHFVGTDVHSNTSTALSIATPLKRVRDIVGDEVYNDIVCSNPQMVIENRDIHAFEPVKGKFSFPNIFRRR